MALVREYLLFSTPCNGIKRFYYVRRLVLSSFWRHGSHIRVALLLMLIGATSRAGEAFGVWKLNPARSTLAGNQKSVTLRIEPHTRGEVFTLDTLTADGRASTFSTILYFDGKPRDFQDSACSGTQSSRRMDSRTVEILRECANGGHRQLIRRSATRSGVLILEIIEQHTDGRRSERRLVMEKQ
jgi:hypothetical protein